MPTGLFFHYQQGERLRDFPQALEGILDKDNVFLFDAFYPFKPKSSFDLDPIPQEALSRVHSPEMIRRVQLTRDYEGALFSAAGTVAAANRIWSGEITNAFVFTGYGDHHAGSDFYGGGCYFNGAAVAIHDLRAKRGGHRFAILDTDAHHGDGTWELFQRDPEVLFACFCSGSASEENSNLNIRVPYPVDDDVYVDLVRDVIEKKVRPFGPHTLFWNWGYDGTIGEYGDMGLGPHVHVRLANVMKTAADEVCGGRLVVVLCGGSRRDLAASLIPQIIRVLAGEA